MRPGAVPAQMGPEGVPDFRVPSDSGQYSQAGGLGQRHWDQASSGHPEDLRECSRPWAGGGGLAWEGGLSPSEGEGSCECSRDRRPG